MNETNVAQQRESDIQSCSDDESNGGSYENYRRNSLPEGYTAYRKTEQNVYDRYESDYEGAETPDQERHEGSCESKKSCKIGWLSNLQIRAGHSRAWFLEEIISTKKFFFRSLIGEKWRL